VTALSPHVGVILGSNATGKTGLPELAAARWRVGRLQDHGIWTVVLHTGWIRELLRELYEEYQKGCIVQ